MLHVHNDGACGKISIFLFLFYASCCGYDIKVFVPSQQRLIIV
jgi:hypothetical protein